MLEDQSKGVHIIALSEHQNKTELLTKTFDCGEKYLNQVARKDLVQFDELGKFKAYVALDGDTLLGYITLAVHQIVSDPESALRKFKSVPVLMIEQIATDKTVQGRGIGRRLMSKAFYAALAVSKQAGITGVALWSHPDAVNFYQSLGFKIIDTKTAGALILSLMILPIETLDLTSAVNLPSVG